MEKHTPVYGKSKAFRIIWIVLISLVVLSMIVLTVAPIM